MRKNFTNDKGSRADLRADSRGVAGSARNLLNRIVFAAAALAVVSFFWHVDAYAASYAQANDTVRLRKEPSTGSTALAMVVEGDKALILDDGGAWTKVSYGGQEGYVRSDFLDFLLELPAGADGALSNGKEGDVVKDLQRLLTARGYYDGPVNGKFGPMTEAAVRDFQKENNLESDGVVGPATANRMNDRTSTRVSANSSGSGADASGGGSGSSGGSGGSGGSGSSGASAETGSSGSAAPETSATGTAESGGRYIQVPGTYRKDDYGEDIKAVQGRLRAHGVYDGPINGKFGPLTERSVIKFQGIIGVDADGVVGRVTMAALDASPESLQKSGSGGGSGGGDSGGGAPSRSGVTMPAWSEAKGYMKIGVVASIYDVRSGVSYNVKSFSNGLHADVEPVTGADTAALKQTYGGSWSWTARPVWVTIGGRVMAAAINGMPHGGGVNDTNGMDGQICLHFLGSMTHNGNRSYAQTLQAAVQEAWQAAQ